MIYPHFDTSFWLKTLNSTYLLSAVFFYFKYQKLNL